MAEEEKKQEKQTNCASCNKPLKRKTQYYRNGKYYCNKKCYKKLVEKQSKESQKDESK